MSLELPKPNRPVFEQPVAMKCTSAQVKFLRKPLQDLGYQFPDVLAIGADYYLVTRYGGLPMCVGTSPDPAEWGCYIVEPYNWQLFLAIAARVRGLTYIPGEYALLNEPKHSVRGVVRIEEANNYSCLVVQGDRNGWVLLESLNKMTLNELLTYFNAPCSTTETTGT